MVEKINFKFTFKLLDIVVEKRYICKTFALEQTNNNKTNIEILQKKY